MLEWIGGFVDISLSTLLIALWYLVMIATVIRVFLRENRSPASRIAWVFVIVTIPYLGVLAYFLLGEVNVGKAYNRRLSANVRKLYREFGKKETGNWEVSKAHLRNERFRNTFTYANSITAFQPVAHNSARLMKDADDTMATIIADIDAAEHSVHGLYYIWLDDQSGENFAEALIRATKRGVKCRLMADAVGSRILIKSKLWQRLKDEGVDVRVALPMHGIFQAVLSARFDLRNHRKITVVDNKITYIGSRNIFDPHYRVKPKYSPWVDIMVRMEGPIVQQHNLLFMTDWLMVSDEKISDVFDKVEPKMDPDGFLAMVVPDGPDLRVDAIPQLYENLFASAREEISITTPYFVPSEGLVDAICAASYAGMKVTLNLPKKNDSMVVGATSRSYYKELLMAGVNLYEYNKGLLHSKLAVIDEELVIIGSSNLDRRSFDLNYENNILFEDKELASAIRARQEDYLRDSDPVYLEDVENWPSWKKAWNNMMAMLSPIL